MVFICGAGRSGTTLLTDLLGMHSEITPLYETEFVTNVMLQLCGGKQKGFSHFQKDFSSLMGEWFNELEKSEKASNEKFYHGPNNILFDKETVTELTTIFLDKLRSSGEAFAPFKEFLVQLFYAHLKVAQQSQPGRRIIVNKTPSYIYILPMLAHLFPNAKFIHCVRDGRAVANSVVKRPFGPNTREEAAWWWADRVEQGHIWGLNNRERYHEVRYEKLVTQPVEELRDVFHFLGNFEVLDEAADILQMKNGSYIYSKAEDIAISTESAAKWRSDPSSASGSEGDLNAFSSEKQKTLLKTFGCWTDVDSDLEKEDDERVENEDGQQSEMIVDESLVAEVTPSDDVDIVTTHKTLELESAFQHSGAALGGS